MTLEQRLRIRGGNKVEKYGLMQNFSSIRQLGAAKTRFLLKFDHIFGPSSGTLGPIQIFFFFCNVHSPNYGGGYFTNFGFLGANFGFLRMSK